MDSIFPRLQVFEIDDQPWFPSILRSRVQANLTDLWTTSIPWIQPSSPATQTARILLGIFAAQIHDYTVIDFCSGAGGPTPYIEQALNHELERQPSDLKSQGEATAGSDRVDFVLTDIAPHVGAWQAVSTRRRHLHYVPRPIDAKNAPENLLSLAGLPPRRILRTFHLSFHHFSDQDALGILRNTFDTADGIAIVELVERSFQSLLLTTLLLIPVMFGTVIRHWDDPVILFFTYFVPIIPLVLVFDGYMSSFRERTPEEILMLVKKAGGAESWEWTCGRERHTWPIGYTTYVVGRKV